MSLIFTDGFEYYTDTTLKWTSNNSVTTATAQARTGSRSLSLFNTALIKKQFASADEHATIIIGCALYRTTATTMVFRLLSDSITTVHLYIDINPANNGVRVFRGDGVTLLGSSGADVAPIGSWFYMEIKAVLNDSTGSVNIKINNTSILSLTGQDTKNGGTKTTFDGFSLNNSTNSTYVDDLYVCNGAGSTNNDFLGDCKVETLMPNAAGTTTQLTSSSGGANYTNVDETTAPSTTDYNGSATDNQYDTYGMSNLVTATGTVYGINVYAYAAKSDAGTKGGAIMVRSGGTDYEQTDVALGTGYLYINKILETDPATSAAWTVTNVNAVEAGFKVKAS